MSFHGLDLSLHCSISWISVAGYSQCTRLLAVVAQDTNAMAKPHSASQWHFIVHACSVSLMSPCPCHSCMARLVLFHPWHCFAHGCAFAQLSCQCNTNCAAIFGVSFESCNLSPGLGASPGEMVFGSLPTHMAPSQPIACLPMAWPIVGLSCDWACTIHCIAPGIRHEPDP